MSTQFLTFRLFHYYRLILAIKICKKSFRTRRQWSGRISVFRLMPHCIIFNISAMSIRPNIYSCKSAKASIGFVNNYFKIIHSFFSKYDIVLCYNIFTFKTGEVYSINRTNIEIILLERLCYHEKTNSIMYARTRNAFFMRKCHIR